MLALFSVLYLGLSVLLLAGVIFGKGVRAVCLVMLLVVFFGGGWIVTACETPEQKAERLAPTPAKPDNPADHLQDFLVLNYKLDLWCGSSVTGCMTIKGTITNPTNVAAKDVTITCDLAGESGTRIGRKAETMYRVFPANNQTKFELDMGVVSSQATMAACKVLKAYPA